MISFPLFIPCVYVCNDIIWKDLFYSLANNTQHKDVILTLTTIEYKKYKFIYNDKAPYEIKKIIEKIYVKYFNYPRDTVYVSVQRYGTWKMIRRRKEREILILNYILSIGKKLNISFNEQVKLFNRIQLAMTYGDINSDDVQYTNGKIIKINGLDMSTLTIKKQYIVKSTDIKISKLSDGWNSYVNRIVKNPLNIS